MGGLGHDSLIAGLFAQYSPHPTIVVLVTAEYGLGYLSAAQILLSWSHAGRIRSEQAFAMLSGTDTDPSVLRPDRPAPAQPARRPQRNRAIHTIAVTRMRCHQPTQAYIQHRRDEGKADREIRRSIKRYLARHLYWILAMASSAGLDKHQ